MNSNLIKCLIFRWWTPSYVVARVTWCVGYVSVITGSLENHASATLLESTVQENYSIAREFSLLSFQSKLHV